MSKTSGKKNKRKAKKAWLPWIAALVGLVLILVAVLLVFKRPVVPEPGEIAGVPRLVADNELVDLGDVKLNTNVQVDFTLTNTGDGTLMFTEKPYVELKDGC